MSSAKWSTRAAYAILKKSMRLMGLDTTEPLAADQNKNITLETLFGPVTESTALSGNLQNPPRIFVYGSGASGDGSRDLQEGDADIIGFPFRVFNDSGFTLSINTSGADTFGSGAYPSDTQLDIASNGGRAVFIWTGTNWIYF